MKTHDFYKIQGKDARYLSELPEFKDGLPHGVVNKTRADVGGTFVAANCDCNYIIVCPFRDLVDSIAADKNNKYPVFKCYGGSRELSFNKYLKDNKIRKIAVTYDSLPKLISWLGDDLSGWKLLIDEYHLILEDMDFRSDAIENLLDNVQKFSHYTFLSATPINEVFEIDFLKQLPHYQVVWDNDVKIQPIRIQCRHLTKGLSKFIQIFLDEGIKAPDINGNITEVEELYIFVNSVATIKQVIDTVGLMPDEVKVCCADRIRNSRILGDYPIESVVSPSKTVNFFTKKCFQGCNLFSNNGLIIIASDAYKTQTLVDVSTTMEQIVGRLRVNDEYNNVFRNTFIHMYSTNHNIPDNDEFMLLMEEKEKEARLLISGWENLNVEQRAVYFKRLNLEGELVSVVDDKMVYNHLKKQSFIFKQELRQCYKDGVSVRNSFANSDKFVATDTQYWNDLSIKLAKATTVSYEQLLKEYLEHPSESYELDYPEFAEFRKYLKESEMNTLRWNKEKMLSLVNDKKLLPKAFFRIHKTGFISSTDLKMRMKSVFGKLGIKTAPKASIIEECDMYSVEKTSKRIKGAVVRGYKLGPIYLTNVPVKEVFDPPKES